MTTPAKMFHRGDKIVINPDFAPPELNGVVYEVVKVNPKNVQASRIGGGRGINYPKTHLEHFTGEVDPANNVAKPQPYRAPKFFDTGEIVTAKMASRDGAITPDTLLVVFKDDGSDKVNVTLLGGAGGRYWRWPRTQLDGHDLGWLTDKLTSRA